MSCKLSESDYYAEQIEGGGENYTAEQGKYLSEWGKTKPKPWQSTTLAELFKFKNKFK